MRVLLLVFFFTNAVQIYAQASLAHYSLVELDSIYKEKSKSKKYKEALNCSLVALEKGKKELNVQDTSYVKLLCRLGLSYKNLRKYKESIIYYQKAIDIQKVKTPKAKDYATSLYSLGIVYFYLGQLSEVENLFVKSLEIREEVLGTKHVQYIASLTALGILYWKKEEYKKALSFCLKGLSISKDVYGEKTVDYSNGLNNLALIYVAMGEYEKAVPIYNQTIEIQKEILGEKHPNYTATLNNLGTLYQRLREYEKAISIYEQALQIRKETLGEKHPYYTTSLNNLGGVYQALGDYKKGLPFLLKAAAINKEIYGENHSKYATNLSNLGILYKKNKQYQEALQVYKQAAAINKENYGEKHSEYATTINNLASLYAEIGEYEKSILLNSQVMNIYKEVYGEKHSYYMVSLHNLSSMYLELNDFQNAWEHVLLAIEANTGLAMTKNIQKTWIDSLRNREYISFEEMNKSLFTLCSLLEKENKDGLEEKQLLVCELALFLLEKCKNEFTGEDDKLRILALGANWVSKAVPILKKEGKDEEALNIVEKNKSVLVLDAVSNKRAYNFGYLPDSLIKEEKGLQGQYTNLKAKIQERRKNEERDSIRAMLTELNLKIDFFKKGVKKSFPKYANLKYQYESIKGREIQALLEEKTAMLEYLIGDSVVYIFYIDKEDIKVYDFAIQNKKLRSKIKSLHNTLSNYKLITQNKKLAYDNYVNQAHWFYKNLVYPALRNIEHVEHLIIITDRELGHLPFEAFLVDEASAQVEKNYGKLHYLINDYKISYSYSATLWKENRGMTSRVNNRQMLGVAANYEKSLDSSMFEQRLPIYKEMREHLTPLPAAIKEVEGLADEFDGFFGFDDLASERVFKEKASDFAVIHLAMHGLLNKQEQLLSSLAFTENSDSLENNFLHAYEISKMELNADLVVLSACETGYGKFERGNGIASLARAFMYAGVPAVIVSLWQVNDFSTSEIMKNLYNNLADGMDKDEALCKAKLQYMKSVKGILVHPAFWSPFILIGDESPVSITRKGTMMPWFMGLAFVLLVMGVIAFRQRKKEVV